MSDIDETHSTTMKRCFDRTVSRLLKLALDGYGAVEICRSTDVGALMAIWRPDPENHPTLHIRFSLYRDEINVDSNLTAAEPFESEKV